MGKVGQCFMELAYLTSQRLTDIRLLRRSQIGPDAITFQPSKTRNSTAQVVGVPITPAIRSVLERIDELNREQKFPTVSAYLITSRNRRPYSASGIRSMWKRACRRAGVADITLKDLRPSSATAIHAGGASVEAVQKRLGHSNIETTEIYLRTKGVAESPVVASLPPKPQKG